MKRYIVLVAVVYLTAVGLLFSIAPDALSMLILGVMTSALAFGYLAGLVPTITYASSFNRSRQSIEESLKVQTTEAWLAVFQIENLFGQKDLDEVFREYKTAVEQQKESNDILSDIDDYINEEFLSVRTWRGLTQQIPGTLTGLGILGTFIGLITGIGSIGFSTVDAALESISALLAGIEMAFYTSIAGVILSILFNMLNHMIWNIMIREYDQFIDSYHKNVIPSSDEQIKRKLNADIKEIIQRLDRIPQKPGLSLSRAGQLSADSSGSEQALMQQVVQGLFNEEFTYYLQPVIELRSKKIVAAEALVRWNHEVLGILPPSTFLPVLERNGYITKLDSYIWDAVCRKIRKWIDTGIRPVPIIVNVSQMDIMAMDVVDHFNKLLKKYSIPPRMIELEIEQDVFVQNSSIISDVAGELRRMGFKVIMDGFNGDYISVNMLRGVEIDELKIDLRYLPENGSNSLQEIFEQARKLGIDMSAEEIGNAEQVANLLDSDCSVGQGDYYYSPMSLSDFESIME